MRFTVVVWAQRREMLLDWTLTIGRRGKKVINRLHSQRCQTGSLQDIRPERDRGALSLRDRSTRLLAERRQSIEDWTLEKL